MFARGQSTNALLHFYGFKCCFPIVLFLIDRVEVLLFVGRAWARTCFQHHVCCNHEQIFVGDWVVASSTLPFFLRSLKRVDVIQNTLAIDMVVLHFILNFQDVNSVQYTKDGLEVDKKLLRRGRREEGLFVLELEHLCLVDSVQNKCVFLELHFCVHLIVTNTSFPRDFFFADDGGFFVVCYDEIVNHWPRRGWK